MNHLELELGKTLFIFGSFTEYQARALQVGLDLYHLQLEEEEQQVSDDVDHHHHDKEEKGRLGRKGMAQEEPAEGTCLGETLMRALEAVEECNGASPTKVEVNKKRQGIVNLGNTCFANVVFQSLVVCPGLSAVLRHMNRFGEEMGGGIASQAPKLYSLGQVARAIEGDVVVRPDEMFLQLSEFFTGEKNMDRPRLEMDQSFPNTGKEHRVQVVGQQQDAEEFLGFLLDSLHKEQVELYNSDDSATQNGHGLNSRQQNMDNDDDEEEGWHEATGGGRNRSLQVRRVGTLHKDRETFVTKLFQGTIRSSVRRSGSKQSVTLQPFMCLRIDVLNKNVKSLHDALELYMSPEHIDNPSQGPIVGSKSIAFDHLPKVLILHLKRFTYNKYTGTFAKLRKMVTYPEEFAVDEAYLTARYSTEIKVGMQSGTRPNASREEREYKLVSVIVHHGDTVARGHYTNFSLDPSTGKWLHFDDSNVHPISLQQVLGSPDAYLLIYRKKHWLG